MTHHKNIFLIIMSIVCFPLLCRSNETMTIVQNPKKTGVKNNKKTKKPKKKTISEMNYDELKETKNRHAAAGNKELALKYMQKMVPLCNDLCERGTLMLEVADTLLETSSPDEAGIMYQEFSTMYPGHERIEYASFKAIECSFSALLIPERDQTATKHTIELAQEFLTHVNFKQYRDNVTSMLTTCNQRLFESETSIINFYLKQNNIAPAQQRIARARSSFISMLPSCEPTILELECLVAQKTNNKELLLQKQAELATCLVPETAHIVAVNKPKRIDHVSKF